MLRSIFALLAALCIAGPAFAGDDHRASWTGCHVGAHLGGISGETRWSDPLGDFGPFVNNQTVDFFHASFGGLAGCNYQYRKVVFGLEGDLSFANVDEISLNDVITQNAIFRTDFHRYGSVRGRLGYDFGNWLLFATGGWAFGDIRQRYQAYTDASLGTLIDSIEEHAKSGWIAGGGIDYAASDNWVIRAEYLHYDFGRYLVADFGGGDLQYAQPGFDVGRVALIYRFD